MTPRLCIGCADTGGRRWHNCLLSNELPPQPASNEGRVRALKFIDVLTAYLLSPPHSNTEEIRKLRSCATTRNVLGHCTETLAAVVEQVKKHEILHAIVPHDGSASKRPKLGCDESTTQESDRAAAPENSPASGTASTRDAGKDKRTADAADGGPSVAECVEAAAAGVAPLALVNPGSMHRELVLRWCRYPPPTCRPTSEACARFSAVSSVRGSRMSPSPSPCRCFVTSRY